MGYIGDLLDAAMENGMEPPALTADEIERVCVLTAVKRARRKKLPRWLPAAALLGLLTACIAAMTASDVFYDVFREKSPTGNYVPVKTKRALVDKAGKPLGQSVTSDGITVTLEGFVGDDAMLSFILDVRRTDGLPMEWEVPYGNIAWPHFGSAYLRVEGVTYTPYPEEPGYSLDYFPLELDLRPMDSDGDPTHMRFLARGETEGYSLAGKDAALTLEWFGGDQPQLSEELAFSQADLAELNSKFPPVAESDLVGRPVAEKFIPYLENPEDCPRDAAGNPISRFLLPDSGKRVPLSSDLPGAYVAAAGFCQGKFEMAVVCDGDETLERLTERDLVFRDGTREYPELLGLDSFSSGQIGWEDWAGMPDYMRPVPQGGYCYYSFPELTDAAMLEGLRPWFPSRTVPASIADGKWEFHFRLDYQTVTVQREVDFITEWEGFPLHFTQLSWSPLSYTVSGVYEAPFTMFHCLDLCRKDYRISFRMRDGGEIVLNNHSMSSSAEKGRPLTFTLSGQMPYVIEPDEVAGFILNDREFPLESARGETSGRP